MVSSFRLDKYEVTVGRFRQFMAAWNNGSGWLPPAGSGKHTHLNGGKGLANSGSPGAYETGWVSSDTANIDLTPLDLGDAPSAPLMWATWTTAPGNNERLPMNYVNWYDAYAFCIWDGGFLPSEAEWEYASAGGEQQRDYPWGSADPGTANQYAIYSCYNDPAPVPDRCNGSIADIAPVGRATHGAGLWGQLDLAGNLSEWTLDWYAMSYVDPCADCAALTQESTVLYRVQRGGDYYYGAQYMHPSARQVHAPLYGSPNIGFRCARIP